jgi:hypothetical protein
LLCRRAPTSRHASELTIVASRTNKTCYASAVWHTRFAMYTLALVLVSSVMGCGRHATDADCRLIVDKSVELQMKAMAENDGAAIAAREQQVRVALQDQIHACESYRVTDKTMACVRAAPTMKDLDECLR